MKLVLSVGQIAGGAVDPSLMINPSEKYFDDSLFFEVHEDDEEEEEEKPRKTSMANMRMYPVLKGSASGSYSNNGFKE